MSGEFHPLSPQIQTDYSISTSEDRMDEVSLSSSHHTSSKSNNYRISSGASVSSRFSRASRKAIVNNSDLGVPLTQTSSLDERDEDDDDGNGSTYVGASAPPSAAFDNSNNNNPPPTTKSYISEDDPFYMFRTDLVQKLSLVSEELNNYLSVVRTTDTAVNTHAVKETKKQLKRHIKHAESTLSDLETTVRVVEKSRQKFPHINDNELSERRQFVDDSKDRIASSKMSMQSDEIKQKFVSDEKALKERRKGGGGLGGGTSSSSSATNGTTNNNNGYYSKARDVESGNTSSTNPERAETMLMLQQQDETLDDLDLAVTRVGYMAETIHEEIDTQNIMLKNLEEDLADAEEQLGVVMGKLAKLLKTKSKCQIGLIIILSLIVLVLFFLVLYT